MRISIEFDFTAEEVGVVDQLLRTLKLLSDDVKTRTVPTASSEAKRTGETINVSLPTMTPSASTSANTTSPPSSSSAALTSSPSPSRPNATPPASTTSTLPASTTSLPPHQKPGEQPANQPLAEAPKKTLQHTYQPLASIESILNKSLVLDGDEVALSSMEAIWGRLAVEPGQKNGDARGIVETAQELATSWVRWLRLNRVVQSAADAARSANRITVFLQKISGSFATEFTNRVITLSLDDLKVNETDSNYNTILHRAELFSSLINVGMVEWTEFTDIINSILPRGERRLIIVALVKSFERDTNLIENLSVGLKTKIRALANELSGSNISNFAAAALRLLSVEPQQKPSNIPDIKQRTYQSRLNLGSLPQIYSLKDQNTSLNTINLDYDSGICLSVAGHDSIYVWNVNGDMVSSGSLGGYTGCASAMDTSLKIAYISASSKRSDQVALECAIFSFDYQKPSSLAQLNIFKRPKSLFVNQLKIGELQGKKQMLSCDYQMDGKVSVSLHNPSDLSEGAAIASHSEHQDIVMEAQFVSALGLVASASRDKTIRLWDPRNSSVASVIGKSKETNHILCLDAFDSYLVTGGSDKIVRLWDIRVAGKAQTVHSRKIDATGILKVAAAPGIGASCVAVATRLGIYLADLEGDKQETLATFKQSQAAVPSGTNLSPYGALNVDICHGLCWSPHGDVLFTAGETTSRIFRGV